MSLLRPALLLLGRSRRLTKRLLWLLLLLLLLRPLWLLHRLLWREHRQRLRVLQLRRQEVLPLLPLLHLLQLSLSAGSYTKITSAYDLELLRVDLHVRTACHGPKPSLRPHSLVSLLLWLLALLALLEIPAAWLLRLSVLRKVATLLLLLLRKLLLGLLSDLSVDRD